MSIRDIELIVGNKVTGYGILKSYPIKDGKKYKMPLYTLTIEGKDDAGNHVSKDFKIFRFGVYKPSLNAAVTTAGLADKQTHTIKKYKYDYRLHSTVGTPYNASDGAWVVWKTFYIHDGAENPETEAYGTIGCVEVCDPDGFVHFNDFIIAISGSTKTDRNEQLLEIAASSKMKITYLKAARPSVISIGFLE